MSLPNVRGCYHMPSGPEQARQVRLESLGAENIQGGVYILVCKYVGLFFGRGKEISLPLLPRPSCNGVIPPEEKS